MIIFSVFELLDEQKCYDFLSTILHPQGLSCPKCQCPTRKYTGGIVIQSYVTYVQMDIITISSPKQFGRERTTNAL